THHFHRAELVHHKWSAVFAQSFLLENDRAWRRQFYTDSDQCHQWQRHEQHEQGKYNVKGPFQGTIAKLIQWNIPHINEWNAGEMVKIGTSRKYVEIIRDNERLHSCLVANIDDIAIFVVSMKG